MATRPFPALLCALLWSCADAPAPPAEEPTQPHAGDCPADSLLAPAPGIPPADTAGLGARIARELPDWRLSTEREIGCRFPLADGSRPDTYWPDWASGRAWWVWHGDFDGDGQEDRLVLLTSRADAKRDLLAVLRGAGGALEVTSPGGWGIEVVPRDTIESAWEERPLVLHGDGVVITFWEKAAELLYWDGRKFATYVLGD